MAKKAFVSFLGTSNYVEFIYKIDGKISVTNKDGKISLIDDMSQINEGDKPLSTRFIQEALVERYCKNWGKDDAILIFATTKAKKRNWKDNGHDGENNELYNQGLEKRFNKMALNADLRIVCITIPEVKSQEDIWELFDTVNNEIKSYKEIYFDITHAYRFIPMFAMSLFNYSQFVNGTEVKWVKYAMLDNIGDLDEVRKTQLEDRDEQTVLDLTSLVQMQEYTQIASDLKNFGRLKSFATSISNSDPRLSEEIKNFDEYIQTNNLEKLREGEYYKNILFCLENIWETLPPLDKIKEGIKNLFNKYGFVDKESYQNVTAAIAWVKDYEMLPQAYTLSQELIIKIVMESIKELDNNPYKSARSAREVMSFREFVGELLGLNDKKLANYNELEEGSEVKNNFSFVSSIFSQITWIKDLKAPYKNIKNNRNNINHANSKTNRELVEYYLKDFNENHEKCMEIIKSNTNFFK